MTDISNYNSFLYNIRENSIPFFVEDSTRKLNDEQFNLLVPDPDIFFESNNITNDERAKQINGAKSDISKLLDTKFIVDIFDVNKTLAAHVNEETKEQYKIIDEEEYKTLDLSIFPCYNNKTRNESLNKSPTCYDETLELFKKLKTTEEKIIELLNDSKLLFKEIIMNTSSSAEMNTYVLPFFREIIYFYNIFSNIDFKKYKYIYIALGTGANPNQIFPNILQEINESFLIILIDDCEDIGFGCITALHNIFTELNTTTTNKKMQSNNNQSNNNQSYYSHNSQLNNSNSYNSKSNTNQSNNSKSYNSQTNNSIITHGLERNDITKMRKTLTERIKHILKKIKTNENQNIDILYIKYNNYGYSLLHCVNKILSENPNINIIINNTIDTGGDIDELFKFLNKLFKNKYFDNLFEPSKISRFYYFATPGTKFYYLNPKNREIYAVLLAKKCIKIEGKNTTNTTIHGDSLDYIKFNDLMNYNFEAVQNCLQEPTTKTKYNRQFYSLTGYQNAIKKKQNNSGIQPISTIGGGKHTRKSLKKYKKKHLTKKRSKYQTKHLTKNKNNKYY